MAARMVYCHPGDNFAAGVTPTSDSGTVDADFPLTQATDGTPSTPCRFTTTSGSVIFDLGAACQVDLCAVIGHNLDGTVTLQGNSSNAWGAPSVSVALPAVTQDGDGYWPNRWVDLSVAVPTAGDRTLRYWRLVVTGNTANLSLGEVWLATRRQLAINYSWGYRVVQSAPSVVHRTDAGVTFAYSYGTRMRALEGELEATDAVVDALAALWVAARGRARSFLVVPEGDTGEAWQVRCAEDSLPRTQEFDDHAIVPVTFEELSRGLA